MSAGPSFTEFLLLCVIGLIVLGPKRLPEVANQIGTWVGHARRMTRNLKRQLEEELDLDKPLNVRPPMHHPAPHDEDTYSPLHAESTSGVAVGAAAVSNPAAKDAVAEDAGTATAPGTDGGERKDS
jgi:sec-independent protein translocase protein TatB